MHILLLPTRYPNWYNEESNIFFKDQAEIVSGPDVKVSVLALIPITIQEILRKKKIKFGLEVSKSENLTTYRFLFPVLPKSKWIQQIIRRVVGAYFMRKYFSNENKPDIVHVHTFIAANLAIYIKSKYQIPYVITEHSSIFLRNIASKYDIQLATKAFKHSDRNIAVSQNFKTVLQKKFNNEFLYVPNVVNTQFFKPGTGEKNNEFTILNIANLNSNKNQQLLIDSFYKIQERYPNLKMRIGGEGPVKEGLKSRISKLGLQKKIVLLGKLSRDDVLSEMQKCQVFALTSNFETFGVVLVEAMACGIPVISTKCGGPESIIDNNLNGILVDKNKFSEGLLNVIENYSTYKADSIRKFVEERFSEFSVRKALFSIYKELI